MNQGPNCFNMRVINGKTEEYFTNICISTLGISNKLESLNNPFNIYVKLFSI